MFLFCQQHAREWATGLTCQRDRARAGRELRDRPADQGAAGQRRGLHLAELQPGRRALLDVRLVASQRKTMINYCPATGTSDPGPPQQLGRRHEPQQRLVLAVRRLLRRATRCTSETLRRPGEYSEPETRNEKWVVDTFPNIKFANNIHSYGGYFMWAPGSYKDDGSARRRPAPNIGIEKYFFEAGEKILSASRTPAARSILPERTGPIADVLYSRRRQLGRRRLVPQGHHRLLVRDRRGPHSRPRRRARRPDRSASSRASARSAPAAARAPAPANAPRQRGSRRGDGVRRGQLRPASSPPTTTRKDVDGAERRLDADGVTQSKSPINYRFI